MLLQRRFWQNEEIESDMFMTCWELAVPMGVVYYLMLCTKARTSGIGRFKVGQLVACS